MASVRLTAIPSTLSSATARARDTTASTSMDPTFDTAAAPDIESVRATASIPSFWSATSRVRDTDATTPMPRRTPSSAVLTYSTESFASIVSSAHQPVCDVTGLG